MSLGFRLSGNAYSIPKIAEWLQQFELGDRDLAFKFLQCFEFITADNFKEYIHAKVLPLAAKQPIAVFACRKLYENVSLFDESGDVISLPIKGHGSEDIVSAEIKNLARINSNILNSPSISDMRKQKIKNIVIIDDIISSGKRLKGFLNAFFTHSSMKSWFSLPNSKIYIISYAYDTNSVEKWHHATIGQKSFIEKIERLAKVKLINEVTLNKGNGFKVEKEFFSKIVSLCERYAPGNSYSLGWKKSMSHVIFSHSCPNNTPVIIWNEDNWNPLFRWRGIEPSLFYELQKHSTLWIPNTIKQIANAIPMTTTDNKFYEIFFCITEISSRFSLPEHILLNCATMSGYSIEHVRIVASQAIENGYFDDELSLTKAGDDLLKYLKRKNKCIEIPELKDILYVPLG